MYEDVEIETSYRYLKIVFSRLKEPIFILGGWAVFFTVNADYKRKAKRDYIGSRDIDLGFEKPGTLKETAAVLEKELKFDFKIENVNGNYEPYGGNPNPCMENIFCPGRRGYRPVCT